MKKTVIAVLLLCLTITTMSAMADENVNSGDPCTVFLCMAGKVMGKSSSECNGAVRKFFSIKAFKKKHRFNPGKTLDMRQDFLGQCTSADPATVSKILSEFGKIRG